MVNKQAVRVVSSYSLGYSRSLSVNWFGSVNNEDVVSLESNISTTSNMQSRVIFAGIHLDVTTMSPFVALAFEGSYDCQLDAIKNGIHILANNWNDTIYYYKVAIPISGVYFISLSYQVEGCNNTAFSGICMIAFGMFLKGVEKHFIQIWKAIAGEKFSEKSTIISTSYMYHFKTHDEILLHFYSTNLPNLFSYHFVLYEPLHQMKAAWALNEVSEKYGKMLFPEVNINEGNLWDVVNYQIKIPVNGLYFITLHSRIDGAVENLLKVVCNSKQSIITIRVKANNKFKPNHFITTISQTALAELKQGDTLHVEAWKTVLSVFFSGFLLYLS